MFDYDNHKMVANYHTHTYLCNHASGTIRESVETAVKRGLEILGFSCHTPYPFPKGYYSGFRMKPEEQPVYVNEIVKLRDEFKDRIKIYVGYEAEYYPKHFDDLLKMLNQYTCDYIIMGQHCIRNEYDGCNIGGETDDLGVVKEYAAQVCEGMKTGAYTYIAHPDMINYHGDIDNYLLVMSDICKTSLELDLPLELNLLGLEDGRIYPRKSFFKMVGEYGCKVIVGCDAHNPSKVAKEEVYREGMAFAKEFNLNIIDKVDLVKPERRKI